MLPISRECGGCTACCTVCEILELDKPIRTKCEHECEIGCAIYENRPKTCQLFFCAWLRGFGTEDERPDKLGLFIEDRSGPPDGMQFFVKEVCKGAANKPKAIDCLKRLKTRSGRNVYLMDWNMDRLIGKFQNVLVGKKKRRQQRTHWQSMNFQLPECQCAACRAKRQREKTDG
jgi:Fe-S-cluster containining protein